MKMTRFTDRITKGWLILLLIAPCVMTSPAQAYRPQRRKQFVNNSLERQLNQALQLAKTGDYPLASEKLFAMTRNPLFFNQRTRIKYILGLMFYEMKMYQVSAFQFVDVVRSNDPKYMRLALQKLSLAADQLEDDTLINYALGKIRVDEFPKNNQDMLHFRIGEYEMRRQHWDIAISNLAAVPTSSPYFVKAKYLQALAEVKNNNLSAALKDYARVVDARADKPVNDTDRVAGLLGMARVYYQAHNWDSAIEMYRQIPKDTELWHESLFELSWADLRDARFRSVLSNMHSLHSPYYEDFYIPESVLLRGIVYLYICQYNEMNKTLSMFWRIYHPVQRAVENFTTENADPMAYFNELDRVERNYDVLKADTQARKGYRLPFLVTRYILKEGDFRRTYTYMNHLRNENKVVGSMPDNWRRSLVGIYARQLLRGRMDTTQKVLGNIARGHLMEIRQDLAELFEQYNFAKYEMLNGEKEQIKKKIQGRGLQHAHVDESKDRAFYIQNGYQYWPFKGEYWLDEIGNYQYLGTSGCVQ